MFWRLILRAEKNGVIVVAVAVVVDNGEGRKEGICHVEDRNTEHLLLGDSLVDSKSKCR